MRDGSLPERHLGDVMAAEWLQWPRRRPGPTLVGMRDPIALRVVPPGSRPRAGESDLEWWALAQRRGDELALNSQDAPSQHLVVFARQPDAQRVHAWTVCSLGREVLPVTIMNGSGEKTTTGRKDLFWVSGGSNGHTGQGQ